MPTVKNVLDAMDALGAKEFQSTTLVWKLEQQGFSQPEINVAIQAAMANGFILFTHRGMMRKALPRPTKLVKPADPAPGAGDPPKT